MSVTLLNWKPYAIRSGSTLNVCLNWPFRALKFHRFFWQHQRIRFFHLDLRSDRDFAKIWLLTVFWGLRKIGLKSLRAHFQDGRHLKQLFLGTELLNLYEDSWGRHWCLLPLKAGLHRVISDGGFQMGDFKWGISNGRFQNQANHLTWLQNEIAYR